MCVGLVYTHRCAVFYSESRCIALSIEPCIPETGRDQTLLQNLLVPLFVIPTLLPTPLLEPRYFLVPYILLRAQVSDVPVWGVALEGLWYAAINAVTMWVFLYKEREGVGRFMW